MIAVESLLHCLHLSRLMLLLRQTFCPPPLPPAADTHAVLRLSYGAEPVLCMSQKYKPLDLRPKKTRAIRRRLTKHQVSFTALCIPPSALIHQPFQRRMSALVPPWLSHRSCCLSHSSIRQQIHGCPLLHCPGAPGSSQTCFMYPVCCQSVFMGSGTGKMSKKVKKWSKLCVHANMLQLGSLHMPCSSVCQYEWEYWNIRVLDL